MGNAAFSEATGVVSHQASGFSVDPSFFVEHPYAPFSIEAHHKIIHIPFDHVRYRLLHRFWNVLMPFWFAGNVLSAQIIFVHAIMSLHCQRMWDGETGMGNGVQIAIAMSKEMNTGKTEAQKCAMAALGMHGAEQL